MIITFLDGGYIIIRDSYNTSTLYEPGWEEKWLKENNITGYTIRNHNGYPWSTVGYYVKNGKEVLDALIELKKELDK